MLKKSLVFLAIGLLAVSMWGCGSSRDSGGSTTGEGTTLADANPVGITNCLTCHNTTNPLVQQYLVSRHANNLLLADKDALNPQFGAPPHEDDPEPNYPLDDRCAACHDKLGDGMLIDNAIAGQPERPIISCESCHGGGQFHNGIPAGIPNPAPTVDQCNQCHGDTVELFHRTSGGGDGTNVRRNITDSHIDNPATSKQANDADSSVPNIIEGYVIKNAEVGGCNSCHIAHEFDLTINNAWANSPHAGHIKAAKEAATQAGAADGATLLANVKAVGVTSATGDAWLHYDWDAKDRQSCQRCHSTTGLMNFLADTANYDQTANDYSHLSGWSKAADGSVTSSGQNEMLFCWGCHTSVQTGEVRDDPNGITLDFVNEGPDSTASGVKEFVVLPDKGDSNVCGACHAGRGNNTSIRTGSRSTRFAGHHAPTAGSLYAATTHTGFEYTDGTGVPLDYTDIPAHAGINEDTHGPCASCHMHNDAAPTEEPRHTFEAAVGDSGAVTAIENQTLCDSCHGAGNMDPADLNGFQALFAAARTEFQNLVKNTTTNYLNADLTQASSTTSVPPRPIGRDNAEINAYGAFQNSLYMVDEPCIYLHNTLYGKRLIFDSVDWLDNGALDGTISAVTFPGVAAWAGATRP